MSSSIAYSVSSNPEFISDSDSNIITNDFNNSDNNKIIINSISSCDDIDNRYGNPVLEKFYDKITSFIPQESCYYCGKPGYYCSGCKGDNCEDDYDNDDICPRCNRDEIDPFDKCRFCRIKSVKRKDIYFCVKTNNFNKEQEKKHKTNSFIL
jgi:hypothetical protein